MKYLYTITATSIIIALFIACKNNNTNKQTVTLDTKNRTTIQWVDSIKNFGTIQEGEKVEMVFNFKNTGSQPFIITQVQPSCGCTIANKPEKPIAPSASGSVSAVFNSAGKEGMVHKSIQVYGNMANKPFSELIFEGEVMKKKH